MLKVDKLEADKLELELELEVVYTIKEVVKSRGKRG